MINTQLTLGLFAPPQADFVDYRGQCNQHPQRAAEAWAAGTKPWCVGVWGAPGTGKSHLLQAAIRRVHENGHLAMYLPLREVRDHGPEILDGLDNIAALALDDLDAIIGDAAWEEALFALYNRCNASDGRLLYASRLAPGATSFHLRDLQSRLTAALIFQLNELDDGEKQSVLREVAHARGMALNAQVVEFLIRRLPRNMHALMAAIEVLDRVSLRERRALTVPFVRAALGLGGA
jgi:DnaA-homolog protein